MEIELDRWVAWGEGGGGGGGYSVDRGDGDRGRVCWRLRCVFLLTWEFALGDGEAGCGEMLCEELRLRGFS
jgi:hypothetical protein